MNDKRIKIMAEAPVLEAIIKMSLPVVLGMMVQILYNLVDIFFIGRLNDANQLAAANLAMPVFIILMAVAGIIGTGASSYISRSLGENKIEVANKTLTISVFICIFLGVFFTFIAVIFMKPIVSMLGASTETYSYAYDYVFVLIISAVAIMLNFSLGQLLRAEGSTMISMIGMLIGTIANIILDPIFIFLLGMGVKGAAIATVLGNVLGAIFYVYCYFARKTMLRIEPSLFCFDKSIFRQIFFIGTPAALSQILMSFALIVSNNISASYSDIVVASMGVASKVVMIGNFIFIGLAAGTQPITGYNYGAKNYTRVHEIILKGIILTFMMGTALLLVLTIFANNILTIFSNTKEVIDTGVIITHALMWSLPFVGGQMFATTTVQAMGKALPALFLSISRQGILFIPLLLILNKWFGFEGFIFAQPITDFVMLIISFAILRSLLKKEEKLVLKVAEIMED